MVTAPPYLLDLPVQEAAINLGVPAATVKSWLARGRKALAAHLDEVGRLRSPLPTGGNDAVGRPFDAPQGRMRAVLGILTPGAGRPDPGRASRFRIRYGDATGRPTGAAEAVTIPVRTLRARIWVAFIPATAWLVGTDPLDAQGNLLEGTRSSCSTPPQLPLLACHQRTLPPTSHG